MTEKTKWNVQLEGRPWGEEGLSRFNMAPNKIDMVQGKLFANDSQRATMLALLLENVGAQRAVQIGDPEVWRAAVAGLTET